MMVTPKETCPRNCPRNCPRKLPQENCRKKTAARKLPQENAGPSQALAQVPAATGRAVRAPAFSLFFGCTSITCRLKGGKRGGSAALPRDT